MWTLSQLKGEKGNVLVVITVIGLLTDTFYLFLGLISLNCELKEERIPIDALCDGFSHLYFQPE